MARYAYLCDKTQCKACHHYCQHTTDLSHAINREKIEAGEAKFKEVGPDVFMEVSAQEED